MFRNSRELRRVIETVDTFGDISSTVRPGRMEPIAHNAIMHALEVRSRGNYRSINSNGNPNTIDDTGTVDMTNVLNIIDEKNKKAATEQQQERTSIRELGIADQTLQIHGARPMRKAEVIIRLIYENANGINNGLSDNEKVEKAKRLHNNLEVDIAAYNKHRLNMRHNDNVNGFNQLFRGGEAEVGSVVAHNIHENIGRVQEGGTCVLAFGTITKKIEADQSAKDMTGLGRWSVMTFQRDGARTRVVCGYNPCYNKAKDNGTSYAQQR